MEALTRSSREILCGLTYQDVISCAGMNQRQAAKRLGVGYNHFNQVIKRLAMGHWFPDVTRPRHRCISQEDIIQTAAEGYTMKDAAFILGIHKSYLQHLCKLWNLRHYFPNCGECSSIAKRGYCN